MQNVIAIVITLAVAFILSCSGEERLLRKVGNVRGSAEDNPKSVSATVDEDEVEVSNQQKDSKNFKLTVHPAVQKIIPVESRVRNLARVFTLDDEWNPPKQCSTLPSTFSTECPYAANTDQKVLCDEGLKLLNKFYCDLGGESREILSNLGAELTAGDLVTQMVFAMNMCSIAKRSGSTIIDTVAANKFGIVLNSKKGQGAENMIMQVLGITDKASPAFIEQKAFLMSEIFKAADDNVVFANTANGLSDIYSQFAYACTYLLMHESNVNY